MKSKFAAVTLSVLPAFFLSLAPAVLASAQETPAPPHTLTNPEVSFPVQFDISPPLSEMATEVSPQQGAHPALPARRPKLQLLMGAAQRGQGPVADEALQMSIGPLVNAAIGLNLLGVGNGFPGYAVPDAPPDVNLAVGDTQVLQWVNVSYAVFDKTTGAILAGPILGNNFWKGFGGACETRNDGDIIAQWDKLAHRWVMAQNVFSSPYMTCVAISQTADATGSYYRFAFPQPGFPDYPKWGVWPDAYYQSQNNFGPSGSGYVGVNACAYERAKMLAGDSTAKQICFQTGIFDDSLLPGDLDSAGTLPPGGQPEVFLGSIDNGTPNIYEYLFHVDFTTPAHSTFTGVGGTMPVPGVNTFSLACGGFGACIPQPSPGEVLDSLGDRLMYRLAYRNFSGDHQTWLVSHSVTSGSSVGERWYEFHAPENSTSLSVFQQGTFAPDNSYRWMGSIAMDQNQDIALGYSLSSSSTFPSINYTGRVPTDPAGTMESEAQIVAGTGSQTNTSNRWGDYTSMALDAADDCTFWYTAEYYTVTAPFDWSTRIASFSFPSCTGAVSTPDFSLSAPTSQSVTQGTTAPYTITVGSSNSFNSAVSLSVTSGCPVNATCIVSPSPVTPPANGTTTATLSVTPSATTPAGTYSGITVTGTSGSLTHTTSVSLTVTAPVATDFSISASPGNLTLKKNQSGKYTVTITPSGGFNSTVTVTANCPSGFTCSFAHGGIIAGGSGSDAYTVTNPSAPRNANYTITFNATGGNRTHSTNVGLKSR